MTIHNQAGSGPIYNRSVTECCGCACEGEKDNATRAPLEFVAISLIIRLEPELVRPARVRLQSRTDRGSPQGQRSDDPARDRCRHRPAPARRARALCPSAGREAHQGAALRGCGARARRLESRAGARDELSSAMDRYHGLIDPSGDRSSSGHQDALDLHSSAAPALSPPLRLSHAGSPAEEAPAESPDVTVFGA